MIVLNISGQDKENITDPDQLIIIPVSTQEDSVTETEAPKRFDVDMTLGTAFSFSPKNYFGPSYYISPGFSYLVTPRFLLSAGVGIEYSRFYPLYSESYNNKDEILPMTRMYLYARGSYLLTPNLTVSGIAYKGINDVPRLAKYSPSFDYNYQGMGIGFNYKFSDSFSMGFEMRIQQNSFSPDFGFNSPDIFVP